MPKKAIPEAEGQAALESFLSGDYLESELATATRYLLQQLQKRHPGAAVELRVVPYGAIQLLAGPKHSRGTPGNVVELGPVAFIELALGKRTFHQLKQSGQLQASGNRSDLAAIFPIFEL